uniref:Uncharacterized protein n=1 Tax=Globisporangium ultimum (strain ATCC 200006 / CBS 805.95 / DAOM BR144) TaxID=431595 RepID=K3X8G1_GLOUD
MATTATSTSSAPSHSTLPRLDKGALPLQRLRDQYERALLEVLGDVDADEVTLVFSSRIATLLTHVLVNGLDVLKQHRDGGFIECVEITDEIDKVHCHTVVYLSSPSVDEIRGVAMHAGMLQSQHDGKNPRALFLYVTGKWTSLCDDVLAQYNLQDDFQTIGCFPMGFVPLDTDLLTLGRERCLCECTIAGDKSVLLDVALALNQLQDLYGKFDHIKYKGELAMLVLNHMVELSQGATHTDTDPDLSQSAAHNRRHHRHRNPMNTLVILDRRVDYASALCTPLTYEALVDEILHIHDGFISLSPMLLTSDPNASDVQMLFALNSNDAIFQQIRSMHIHAIPRFLHQEANTIKSSFTRFQNESASATAAEVHEFVKGVPQMKQSQQNLEHHINLLEYLELTTTSRAFRDQWTLERAIMDCDAADSDNTLEDIQERIFRHESLPRVLRLLCLYCAVHDGLKRHELERMKLHLVRTYGHELVFSFDNLERLGLLYERHVAQGESRGSNLNGSDRSSSLFHVVANALGVIDLNINVENPRNTAFVTSGYAPISCRLVEEVLRCESWRAIDSVMSTLHGPRAEINRIDGKESITRHKSNSNDNEAPVSPTSSTKTSSSKKKHVMVACFVGGVTYLEIAALRWLAQFCTLRFFFLFDLHIHTKSWSPQRVS